MIRDRISCELKDFAFIEYFTLDEANYALGEIRKNGLKIRNQTVNVTYSKIRRMEDLKVI